MKNVIDIKRFKFYIRIGLAYLFLWLFIDLVSHPALFPKYFLNETWRAIYIVIVNYLFFEYTLLNLSKKRILTSIFLLIVQIILYSAGLYAWRHTGIRLSIYTEFITYTTRGKGSRTNSQPACFRFSFLP